MAKYSPEENGKCGKFRVRMLTAFALFVSVGVFIGTCVKFVEFILHMFF